MRISPTVHKVWHFELPTTSTRTTRAMERRSPPSRCFTIHIMHAVQGGGEVFVPTMTRAWMLSQFSWFPTFLVRHLIVFPQLAPAPSSVHSHLPPASPTKAFFSLLDKFPVGYLRSTGICTVLSSASTYRTVPGPLLGERVERKESLGVCMVNSTGTFVKLYMKNSSEL